MVGNDARIRIIQVDAFGHTIGELRNFGAAEAAGEIIAHWDDDDWSAPVRLEDQVGRLRETGKAVTGYSSMLFTGGPQWWLYTGMPNYVIGTSLCYRKDWWQQHPFLPKQVGEDGEFGRSANFELQLAVVPAGQLMVATVHQKNTSPRLLSGDQWKELKGFPGIPGFSMP